MLKKIYDKIYLLEGVQSCNIYYFDFTKKALIDTGHPKECKKNFNIFKKNGFFLDKIDYILNTHSHGDHVGANEYLKKRNPSIKIIGSKKTYEYQHLRKKINVLKGAEDDFEQYKIDIEVKDKSEIDLGGCILKVLETPGHTRDSLSFYLQEKNCLFSGDLIYYKVITQLDYYQDLMKSLSELENSYNKIKKLDNHIIYIGHGDGIDNPNENIEACFKKIEKFKRNPEIIIINTLVPSAEFFIYKNKGCTIEKVSAFFVQNMLKFKKEPFFKHINEDRFLEIIEKMISLMMMMNIVKLKNKKLYLSNEINQHLGLRKSRFKKK